ncbi:Quinolinate synthetase A [Parasponia andersonii]|uniref:Quinolinate synthase, chloroplastic n=1 Tax=Parasponia andersonii TaxID=3476 RepID=A0A2P5DGA2_PARAD|nr:Quinolinate synthetase A [Parasponia andersonii]
MDSSSATMAFRAASSSFSSSSSTLFSISKPGLFKVQTQKSHFVKTLKCIQSPPPDPNPLKSRPRSAGSSSSSPFSCSAVTFSPLQTNELVPYKLQRLVAEFRSLPEPIERVKRLLHCAGLLPQFDDSSRVDSNRVMGCTAQVWLEANLDEGGRMRFAADSDSEITRGFCYCLVAILDGAAPEEVLAVKTEDLEALNVGLPGGVQRSRVNTWHNVLISMQKKTRALMAEREGKPPFEPFPSLVVTADGIHAKGSYAEAQARYLFPDEFKVQQLVNVLKEKRIGIVAHFYMDPEVQGVLTAAQKQWPHIHISDSLVMADSAVKMAKSGCKFITVLGVDFMSENVRAILDQAGFAEGRGGLAYGQVSVVSDMKSGLYWGKQVGVYRMSNERIGCSLADAASAPAYMSYLQAASKAPPSLHVVYINTALETKAFAHELVPTITCTSSNVVQTILKAFAQVPDLHVWYGPDSYMGANIVELFQQMTKMTDEEIAEVHPEHNRDSIKSLLPRLHYYPDGTCVVHHLFGHEVVEKINEMYSDAFLTAHFEVPGEMFSLAMEAKRRGMGVVGSTQNILDFIKQRVQEALDRNVSDYLQFVLGTESGMVTSIVAAVHSLLNSYQSGAKVKVEIVFPVSSDSMTRASSNSSLDLKSIKFGDVMLPVIPGVASGEGCSIHGGCASCPYMKMNSLSSLLKVCHHLPDESNILTPYKAERFKLQTPNGKSIADIGREPILHMRHFQASKELPKKLVNDILHPRSSRR